MSYKLILNNAKEYTIEEPTKAELKTQVENGLKGDQLSFITAYRAASKGSPLQFLATAVASLN